MLLLGQVCHCIFLVFYTSSLYIQTDRAVQLLLETDAGSTEYYADALKCVVSLFHRSYLILLCCSLGHVLPLLYAHQVLLKALSS